MTDACTWPLIRHGQLSRFPISDRRRIEILARQIMGAVWIRQQAASIVAIHSHDADVNLQPTQMDRAAIEYALQPRTCRPRPPQGIDALCECGA